MEKAINAPTIADDAVCKRVAPRNLMFPIFMPDNIPLSLNVFMIKSVFSKLANPSAVVII